MSSRTLFVGDVHGCANELETMLQLAEPTRCILVGDMFRKGPDELGVWHLIQSHQLEAVLGNHELVVLKKRKKYPLDLVQWVEQLPLWIEGEGNQNGQPISWRVVHAGVDPFHPKRTTRKQAVSMRRYPNDKSKLFPFWWQVYKKKRLVIYGHDAKRGLQDHRPKTLGLDSGCVYGNGLTGYLLEEDRLIQVPSQAIHLPIVE